MCHRNSRRSPRSRRVRICTVRAVHEAIESRQGPPRRNFENSAVAVGATILSRAVKLAVRPQRQSTRSRAVDAMELMKNRQRSARRNLEHDPAAFPIALVSAAFPHCPVKVAVSPLGEKPRGINAGSAIEIEQVGVGLRGCRRDHQDERCEYECRTAAKGLQFHVWLLPHCVTVMKSLRPEKKAPSPALRDFSGPGCPVMGARY